MDKKNSLGQYFARRANTGARSRKGGQSRYYVGYKKHTLRLWLRQHSSSILLAPLISWAAPANRDDCVFLEPSIHYCAQQLQWTPDMASADSCQRNLRKANRQVCPTFGAARLQRDGAHGGTRPTTWLVKGIIPVKNRFGQWRL